MSILTKNFGKRQDAIITDCYVVMPDGVRDSDGNCRFAKLKTQHGILVQPILSFLMKSWMF